MQGKKIIALSFNNFVFLLTGIILLSPTVQGLCQLPSDTIKPGSLNQNLISQLIRNGIDSLRNRAGAPSLIPDSVLTAAATDQASYLIEYHTSGHSQPGFRKSNVGRRIDYYGGTCTQCGENVAVTFVHELMENRKTRRRYYNYTYQDLADEFIRLWAESQGHLANAVNPQYRYTGVCVVIHPKTHRAAAVQVFSAGAQEKKKS
ncbi:MAG TPA: CAP domain-containing protein [Bacteroidales bacterium]|nr:CAP domain-containing protein [Bacteroidales bacterium]HRZ49197.1 CAP domain-containing protein [Bacteroidales bacterium]